MVFKNIEYMNGGCFENLSGTSVPKSIGRGPPGGTQRHPHPNFLLLYFYINIIIYHILGSDYAEFAQRDIDDVTITNISTPCKKCISISARVQKMHINDVTMKKYVTTNKSTVKYFRILSYFTTTILA